MRRSQRLIASAVVIALSGVLAGCLPLRADLAALFDFGSSGGGAAAAAAASAFC